jgi:hypothetical protein
VTGKELPTARYVSAINHRDFGFHDHAVTVYLPAWGQLIDHDMTMGAESKGIDTQTHNEIHLMHTCSSLLVGQWQRVAS